MNNSKIVIDNVSLTLEENGDNSENLRVREAELVRIIEAIERVNQSEDWNTLKVLVLSGVEASLEKRLRLESEKPDLNTAEIHRLQGQLAWARKFADLSKLGEAFRTELFNIRKLIK